MARGKPVSALLRMILGHSQHPFDTHDVKLAAHIAGHCHNKALLCLLRAGRSLAQIQLAGLHALFSAVYGKTLRHSGEYLRHVQTAGLDNVILV